MYLVKYILLNTVCHSHTILFIAVSIKNIVNMRAATNNSLKHVHVCHSLDVTTVWQDIASAVWRTYSQLRRTESSHRRSKGRKIYALLAQNFQRRPQFFWHVFGRAPNDLLLCFVQLKALAPSARYSTFKYPVTLQSRLQVA